MKKAIMGLGVVISIFGLLILFVTIAAILVRPKLQQEAFQKYADSIRMQHRDTMCLEINATQLCWDSCHICKRQVFWLCDSVSSCNPTLDHIKH